MAIDKEADETDRQPFRSGDLWGTPTPIYDKKGNQVGTSWANLHIRPRRTGPGGESKPQPKKGS